LNSTEAIETNRDSAEQSLRQPNLDAGRLKIGSELFRIGAEVGGIDLEFPKRIEPIDTDNYLRTFFRELDRLKPPQLWARSHAITYQQASICVLISVGDCRRKVFVESLDPDPSEAAQKVMAAWRKLKEQNEVKDFE
jgi:hypothetical protein